MPPQSASESLHLKVLPGLFSVSQFSITKPVDIVLLDKLQLAGAKFISITRTDEEISVVEEVADAETASAEWKGIKIEGPMDFGLTGILHDLSAPLKAASISIFAISTWNTDYVFIKRDKAEEAVRVLSDDGWHFVEGQ
ncbi:unnamed protein product [Peniophora sp. CBMAI 1063]|nr:unnamed protein product [Peniophora sp. CBMAI 1063]